MYRMPHRSNSPVISSTKYIYIYSTNDVRRPNLHKVYSTNDVRPNLHHPSSIPLTEYIIHNIVIAVVHTFFHAAGKIGIIVSKCCANARNPEIKFHRKACVYKIQGEESKVLSIRKAMDSVWNMICFL